MTPILPELKSALGERATRLAIEHEGQSRTRSARRRRPPRRGRRAALGILIALGFSGAAVASQGVWRPVLSGGPSGSGATVSAAPLSPALLERFAVLRRPQTDADRGVDALSVLRWQRRGARIQTDGVRLLGTTSTGTAFVLVPYAAGNAPEGTATRAVCLWQRGRGEEDIGGGCANTGDVLRRGLDLFVGPQPGASAAPQDRPRRVHSDEPELRQRRDGNGSFARVDPDLNAVRFSLNGAGTFATLLPDRVSAVRVGAGDSARTVRPTDDFAQFSVRERDLASVVWLDERGDVVGPPRP